MLVLRANDDPETRNCWLARAVNPPWQVAFIRTISGLAANADDDNSSMFANGGAWLVEVQWDVLDPQRRTTNGDGVCYRGENNKFPITVRSLISTGVASKSMSRGGKEYYVRSKEMHDSIEDYGNRKHGCLRD